MLKRLRGHEQTAIILTAALINLMFVFLHECWFDEVQAWLIARDNDIFSIFDLTSYEGHPFLWFYVLMPFARMGFPFFTLKIISYVIMLLVIVLIVKKAPFDNYLKALFVLCPMCIYCFVTPARPYCMCALFTVLAAMYYKDKAENPLIYGIILALNLQTHIIMAGFVVASCVEWFVNVFTDLYRNRKLTRKILMQVIGMAIPFLSGLFLLYEFRDISPLHPALEETNVFVIPEWIKTFSFSNSATIKYTVFWAAVSAFVVVMSSILLRGRKLLRNMTGGFCVVMASTGWQLFIHVFIWILGNFKVITWAYFLLWFLWILYDTNKEISGISFLNKKVVPFILIMNIILWCGITRMYEDIFFKYSGAEDAAAFIETLPDDAVIFELREEFCNAVVPYLKTKKIYNPFTEKEASYMNYDPSLKTSMSYDEFIAVCKKMFPDVSSIYAIQCPIGKKAVHNLAGHLTKDNLCYTDFHETTIRQVWGKFSIYRLEIK